jgi:5-methylcytosine-specific restriction endonuclease McrA
MNLTRTKKCPQCGENKLVIYDYDLRADTGRLRTICMQFKYQNDINKSNQKYNSDPEYRRKTNQRTTEWKRQQSATNPEYRARHRQRQAEYAKTPEGVLGAFRRESEYRCIGEFVYVPFTYEELEERMNVFNGRCAYCDRKVKLVRDHVHPLAHGGHHAIYNIIPCCNRCNVSKGNSFIFRWYPKQPFYSIVRHSMISMMCKPSN